MLVKIESRDLKKVIMWEASTFEYWPTAIQKEFFEEGFEFNLMNIKVGDKSIVLVRHENIFSTVWEKARFSVARIDDIYYAVDGDISVWQNGVRIQ